MQEEIKRVLENDQICYRESEDAESTYNVKLHKVQKEHTDKIFDFLEKDFGIKLKIFHHIPLEP